MSPISPISPPFNHAIPLSTSNKVNNPAPFIYTVPVYIPPCRTNTGTRFSTLRSRQRVMPSSSAPPISAAHRNIWRTQTTHAENVNNKHDDHDSNSQSEENGVTQAQSTTRITGFIPINDHQPPMADHPSRPVERLSPSPRRPSHSQLPWILPGNDNAEDDVAYSQMDPTMFEFKRHLLRRIENRDASQFMSFHSCL